MTIEALTVKIIKDRQRFMWNLAQKRFADSGRGCLYLELSEVGPEAFCIAWLDASDLDDTGIDESSEIKLRTLVDTYDPTSEAVVLALQDNEALVMRMQGSQ